MFQRGMAMKNSPPHDIFSKMVPPKTRLWIHLLIPARVFGVGTGNILGMSLYINFRSWVIDCIPHSKLPYQILQFVPCLLSTCVILLIFRNEAYDEKHALAYQGVCWMSAHFKHRMHIGMIEPCWVNFSKIIQMIN